MDKIYDIGIIGAGVVGANIARKLSQYELSICILEKEADVSFGISKANSGIIHAGFHHPPKYLKSRLELEGNLMFDRLQKELHFPFKRSGILVVAFSEEEMKSCYQLYDQGMINGVIGLELCNRNRILQLEPKLGQEVIGGLYAPTGGIVEPYRFVFALIESAKKNGVEIKLNFKVKSAKFNGEYYEIFSNKNEKINAKYIINCAGLFADEVSKICGGEEFNIKPRKGEYFLIDKSASYIPSKVIFPVPTSVSKGILVIPTVEGTCLLGPTAEDIDDKEDLSTNRENLSKILYLTKKIISQISEKDIITSFAGVRAALDTNDFYIEWSKKSKNLLQVAGIQSPGLTASPAIANYVKDLLKERNIKLVEKQNWDPFIEDIPRIRHLEDFEVDFLYNKDNSFANVICRCEQVSEAEIREAIRKGHTTLDGIKFYTRAGMGRCQGGFCSYKIMKILSEELNIDLTEITKRGENSYILYKKL
jgi:glycerol-3-phosphate dehydrogenase